VQLAHLGAPKRLNKGPKGYAAKFINAADKGKENQVD
jgi:hypothetical protein